MNNLQAKDAEVGKTYKTSTRRVVTVKAFEGDKVVCVSAATGNNVTVPGKFEFIAEIDSEGNEISCAVEEATETTEAPAEEATETTEAPAEEAPKPKKKVKQPAKPSVKQPAKPRTTDPRKQLSYKDPELLKLLEEGCTAREIATAMDKEMQTVSIRIQHLKNKGALPEASYYHQSNTAERNRQKEEEKAKKVEEAPAEEATETTEAPAEEATETTEAPAEEATETTEAPAEEATETTEAPAEEKVDPTTT